MAIPPLHQAFVDGALPVLQADERLLGVAATEGENNKRLVAYLTKSNDRKEGSAELGAQAGEDSSFSAEAINAELRDWLSSHLPEYMVPAQFMWLDALPVAGWEDPLASPLEAFKYLIMPSFCLALPFSEGAILWSEPITVPREADEAELERLRLLLEERLNTLTAEADRRCGQTAVQPAPVPGTIGHAGA